MSNYNRYSNYPSTIDKLKQLPEYNDMTVEDKEKIGRYNELLTKNALTSNEEAELRKLISELRDKMITSQDYNCVIGAITNQETFYKDGVLGDIGNIVDVAERDVHDYCVYTKNDTKTFSDNKKGEMLRIRNDFNEWYRNLVQSLPTDKAMSLLQQIRDLQNDTQNIDFKEVTIRDNVLATSDLFGGEIRIKKASGITEKGNMIINSGYCKTLEHWSKMIGGGAEGSNVILDNQKGVGLECTNTGGWCILYNDTFEKEGFKFDTNKQYTLKGKIWCSNEIRSTIQICDGNSSNIVMSDTSTYYKGYNDFNFSFKPNCQGNQNHIRFCIQSAGSMFVKYVQLTEKTQDLPSWTQSIGTCSFGDGSTGGIKICTVNKNLFNPKIILDKSEDNITIENIGTGYKISSTTSTKENAYVEETVKGLVSSQTYVLSSNANIVHGNGIPKIQVRSNGQVLGEINGTGDKDISFVAKSDSVEVLLYITPDCTGENVYEYENIMIEKGLYKSDYIQHREDTLIIPTVLRSYRGSQDELIGNKIIRRVNVSETTDSNSWSLYNPPHEEFYEEAFTIHGYPDGCIYIDNDVKGNVTLQYAKTIATGVYVNSNEIQLVKELLDSKVGDIENIKQNQLEMVMQRDLANQSTDMDCGYWFDSLKNMDKINVLNRCNLNSNTITDSDNGEIEWKEYVIGFKTNKITYYHNRKQSAITCSKENINKGEVEINIQSAEITID